jgi:hypothetical protein
VNDAFASFYYDAFQVEALIGIKALIIIRKEQSTDAMIAESPEGCDEKQNTPTIEPDISPISRLILQKTEEKLKGNGTQS